MCERARSHYQTLYSLDFAFVKTTIATNIGHTLCSRIPHAHNHVLGRKRREIYEFMWTKIWIFVDVVCVIVVWCVFFFCSVATWQSPKCVFKQQRQQQKPKSFQLLLQCSCCVREHIWNFIFARLNPICSCHELRGAAKIRRRMQPLFAHCAMWV